MCAKHAAQFDQATINASNAVAPCPLACTISGLTSISVSSGTVCISRPMAMTTCATAAMSAGGAPRKPASSLAVRRLCNASTICLSSASTGKSFTSPSASTQMPPRPSSNTVPQPGSRLAPTISSIPFGDIFSTRAPSSAMPGAARLTFSTNVSQAARSALSSARFKMTPPASVLCDSAAACAFSTTG